MRERVRRYLARPVDAASMAAFRIVFGAALVLGTIRLLGKGYVHEAFVAPRMFFPPWPLADVIRPLPGWGMYGVYVGIALAALALAAGFRTRLAAALVCLLFTYAHFVDLTNYLNHYWLVTLLTGLMVVLPVAGTLSVDARLFPLRRQERVPAWTLYVLRFQVAVVYVFAGVAKLGPDWLLRAQPLRTWLLANTDMPILGSLFRHAWMAYAMSWAGAAFDLTIVLWLLWRRTRPLAYACIVFFHLVTARLFNIGMFPYFMMAASLLFLDPSWPRSWVQRFVRRGSDPHAQQQPGAPGASPEAGRSVAAGHTSKRETSRTFAPADIPWIPLAAFALVQIALPLRSHLYGGNVLWHEQGFRYSWRVMLMEKMGSAEFTLRDRATGATRRVRLRDYLTPSQQKAMATQPDMILGFARHLARKERDQGRDVAVYADVLVVLNGRPAARLVDPTTDLGVQEDGLSPRTWILPAPP